MKRAYPNFSAPDSNVQPVYDLSKWIAGMREIYAKVHYGNPFKDSFNAITANWGPVEKKDFSAWLEYYQSNTHLKYKKAGLNTNAQFYVSQDVPGYFLPNPTRPQDNNNAAINVSSPTAVVEQDHQDRLSQDQKRKIIEEQRKKIIGRLNAAIKHLTSYEGHLLTGAEFDSLLASMYELLKQFQTVNKVSLSNQLYTDLIIRQANKLARSGCNKSSSFLRKFADLPGMPGVPTGPGVPGKLDFPQGVIPIASERSDGVAGSLPSNAPPAEAIAPPEELKEDPLDELLNNLETAGLTDVNLSEDDEEIELDEELMVEAQLAPTSPISSPPAPALTSLSPAMAPKPVVENKPEEELEVTLTEKPVDTDPSEKGKDIDIIIDEALSNISIKDVVSKLEDTLAMFRNRQLARELMTIDLMLHSLGLSSLFGELSEAQQKTLDASNYVVSRLEKILSQLNGAINKSTIDLNPVEKSLNEDVQNVKEQIENKQERDKLNKERRKQMEAEELNAPPTPQVEEAPAIPPADEIAAAPAPVIV